ncbi:MAG: hypothetical protein QOI99_1612 [Actinomycetota bacterium]|jgi:hypothetical protein|nr:hypothetical protein [Actinomycetota bacterium]
MSGADAPPPHQPAPTPWAGPFRDPDVPAEVLGRWFQAEERLYPVVMVMPERYELVVSLVGRVAEQLRATCPDLAALATADADARDLAQRLASFDPTTAPEIDLSMIAGAACSIVYRELAARRGPA